MPKKALIIVDMLNDFVDENGALFCGQQAREIIPFIQERLSKFRQQHDLVVFLQDSHRENDREFEKFPKHCVAGTWGNRIIPDLAPQTGETVLPKSRYSGFFGTNLADILIDGGIEEVEVVGVCTSICVMDTVGGLANRDYEITVPKKGVADFDAEFHEFALKRIQKIYGGQVI